ncbi:hypothetical protein EVG20_g9496 [Dentipellis fragilis]|uniref:Ubiquitin-like domain-containing protein n=1 Tax=Dentipellis fragilis TaxID=205917 RepID=A0A4Y9XXH4_9AGAM|nr:hypothetical protein EVG20_g9496 [Dentipellis fragilis]
MQSLDKYLVYVSSQFPPPSSLMPLVAFSFGSVGDIIAVVQLLNQVRRALCDSTGSAAEYQALIADLDAFADVLCAVQHALNPPAYQPARRRSVPPPVANAWCHALQMSAGLLDEIRRKVLKYQDSLRIGGSGSMMRDSWRKVGWALFKKPELEGIRRRVMDQVEVLNILLSLLSRHDATQQCNTLSTVESSVRQLPVEMREQRMMLRDIHRCLRGLPIALGYTWEGGRTPQQQPIIFTDMMNQTTLLPFELCDTWERFEGMLKVYHKGRPFFPYVEDGRYVVVLSGVRPTMTYKDSTWPQYAKPGSKLELGVRLPVPWKMRDVHMEEYHKTGKCFCDGNSRIGLISWPDSPLREILKHMVNKRRIVPGAKSCRRRFYSQIIHCIDPSVTSMATATFS